MNNSRVPTYDPHACRHNFEVTKTNIMKKYDKPLWQLTTQEFIEILTEIMEKREYVEPEIPRENETDDKQYVYGLAGIANLLGCSKSKVSRLKQSTLKPAIIQNGRSIIGDANLLIKLYNKNEDFSDQKSEAL